MQAVYQTKNQIGLAWGLVKCFNNWCLIVFVLMFSMEIICIHSEDMQHALFGPYMSIVAFT